MAPLNNFNETQHFIADKTKQLWLCFYVVALNLYVLFLIVNSILFPTTNLLKLFAQFHMVCVCGFFPGVITEMKLPFVLAMKNLKNCEAESNFIS